MLIDPANCHAGLELYANIAEVLTNDELRDRANKPAQKTPEPQKGKGLLNRILGK